MVNDIQRELIKSGRKKTDEEGEKLGNRKKSGGIKIWSTEDI